MPASAQLLLEDALAREGEAHRLLLEGEARRAARPLRETAELYRSSWEEAGPRSYGRLLGMLKATVLGGSGEDEAAAYALGAVGDTPDSPASSYVVALAALIRGDDERARRAVVGMRGDGDADAFSRTADAIDAVAAGDGTGYAEALRAILADFEGRQQHLTGVAIADTALVLERLAAKRGIAAEVSSPMLPARGVRA
jgi:hypothetical protein